VVCATVTVNTELSPPEPLFRGQVQGCFPWSSDHSTLSASGHMILVLDVLLCEDSSFNMYSSQTAGCVWHLSTAPCRDCRPRSVAHTAYTAHTRSAAQDSHTRKHHTKTKRLGSCENIKENLTCGAYTVMGQRAEWLNLVTLTCPPENQRRVCD